MQRDFKVVSHNVLTRKHDQVHSSVFTTTTSLIETTSERARWTLHIDIWWRLILIRRQKRSSAARTLSSRRPLSKSEFCQKLKLDQDGVREEQDPGGRRHWVPGPARRRSERAAGPPHLRARQGHGAVRPGQGGAPQELPGRRRHARQGRSLRPGQPRERRQGRRRGHLHGGFAADRRPDQDHRRHQGGRQRQEVLPVGVRPGRGPHGHRGAGEIHPVQQGGRPARHRGRRHPLHLRRGRVLRRLRAPHHRAGRRPRSPRRQGGHPRRRRRQGRVRGGGRHRDVHGARRRRPARGEQDAVHQAAGEHAVAQRAAGAVGEEDRQGVPAGARPRGRRAQADPRVADAAEHHPGDRARGVRARGADGLGDRPGEGGGGHRAVPGRQVHHRRRVPQQVPLMKKTRVTCGRGSIWLRMPSCSRCVRRQ